MNCTLKPLKDTLAEAISQLMATDKRVHLIDVDLGTVYGSMQIQKNYPNRYHQVGIAEQNAIGIAAGIAASGGLPIVVSLACFITGRCYDQLRLNCGLSSFPIVVIGLHAGSFLGQDGPTHQSCDDLGLISSLPNFDIIHPINPQSTHRINI